jgi:hypothetical protein
MQNSEAWKERIILQSAIFNLQFVARRRLAYCPPFEFPQGGPSTKAQDGERKSNHELVEPRPDLSACPRGQARRRKGSLLGRGSVNDPGEFPILNGN